MNEKKTVRKQKDNPTILVSDRVARCEEINELKEYIQESLKSQSEQWKERFQEIKSRCGCTTIRLAEQCGVNRWTINEWRKGIIPRNRESYILLGLAAGYSEEEMNVLLQRYGRYPGLYPKTREDCVCMYVIQHYPKEERAERYKEILLEMQKEIPYLTMAKADVDSHDHGGSGTGSGGGSVGVANASGNRQTVRTVSVERWVNELGDDDELMAFIQDKAYVFATAYREFYALTNIFVEENYTRYSTNVSELAYAQGWSASLRRAVSEIHQKKWIPSRNKIISLGLHLSMDLAQINQLLQLAHMEPLYAKNIFECVILYILESAEIQDMLDDTAEDYDPDALWKYAGEVIREIEIPEIEFFYSELRDEE